MASNFQKAGRLAVSVVLRLLAGVDGSEVKKNRRYLEKRLKSYDSGLVHKALDMAEGRTSWLQRMSIVPMAALSPVETVKLIDILIVILRILREIAAKRV